MSRQLPLNDLTGGVSLPSRPPYDLARSCDWDPGVGPVRARHAAPIEIRVNNPPVNRSPAATGACRELACDMYSFPAVCPVWLTIGENILLVKPGWEATRRINPSAGSGDKERK